MKKVCIVSLGYMWFPVESGPSRFFQIAQTFVKRGYEVDIVTTDFMHYKKVPRDTELILAQGYPFQIHFIPTMPYKRNVGFKRIISNRRVEKRVKEYMEEHIKEFDVVYCAIPANNISAAVSEICKRNQVPMVVDIEDLWPEAMSMVIKNDFVRGILCHSFQKDAETTYKNCQAAIGTSEDYTARAVKYNHRNLPMETVYVGCNLKDFDDGAEENRQFIEKAEGEFWVSYAGSISTSYDIINVIHAAEILSQDEETSNIHFQILGTGSEKEALEKYIEENKVLNVHFWGFTEYPKMAAVLVASDVVVNSFVKGAPQSIVNKVGDYLACKKPMINTLENPVFTDLVERNSVGVNVAPKEPEALAKAIREYYMDPVRVQKEGQNARRLAETAFDREVSYQKIVDVVEQVMR